MSHVRNEKWHAVLAGILPEGIKFDFWANMFNGMHPVCRFFRTVRHCCPKWCRIAVFTRILTPPPPPARTRVLFPLLWGRAYAHPRAVFDFLETQSPNCGATHKPVTTNMLVCH